MRRQPDLLDAALQASRTSLDPGSIPNGASTTARAESKAPSPSAFAAAGVPRPSVGGLSPMAQPPPPAEERLLPNGNVCHFAGCGCADGVSGEIRAALKECVSNMRQQQQLQQQQQQQQHQQPQAGGPCGCPSLLRGACEHQTRQPAPQPLKSLLKRPSTARPRRGSRVRFSDTLTVFSEDYPEAQLYVIRTAELTFAEVCSMYEPPPEYRDLPPFDPPDGYRDDAYLLPFLREARAAAAAARAAAAAAAAANGNNLAAAPQGTATGPAGSLPAPQGPHAGPVVQQGQVKVAERPPPPPPPPRPAFIVDARGTSREGVRLPPPPPPIRVEITPVETKPKGDTVEVDTTRTEENLDKPVSTVDQEDVKTVVVVSEEESRGEHEDPAVIIEDEDEAILLELKKQLECNNGGDIEADLAELLPPGLVLADINKDLDDDVKVCFERDREEDLRDSDAPLVTVSAPTVTTVTSSTPTTPTTPTSDERQDDSDSSADSQDTIILMTNEEEKKAEDAEQPTTQRFRQKLLIIGDKSPSDTSSVSSSTSQDSDASLRSTESTSTTNSEDRTESPAGSSGSSGRANPVDDDDEYGDEEDGDLDVLDFGPHSNSQVRKTIERTAMRRSLTRVTDVRKRSRNLAKSPTSSSDVSLVEKLRWLTSLDDDDPNGSLPPDAQYHQQMQRRPSQDGSQDRALPPSAYPRPMFQQRPASFTQLGDSRGSHTMIPVAPRDYRMVRRVPGENHPQQNRVPPPPPPRPPSGDKETPPDELERFVQQDMERTERIRKRYSLSEDDEDPSFGFARRPSVRGIRSRFGSTSEILKEVQLHHPGMNLPGSHLSWSHPVELPPNHKTPQQVKVMLLPRVAEEDPVCRNYGSAGDIATLTRSRRIFQPGGGPPPPGNGAKDERGVPEGACASPKVPADPIYHVQPKTAPLPVVSEAPQGVVYYSLNV